jgi:hypothetical protein
MRVIERDFSLEIDGQLGDGDQPSCLEDSQSFCSRPAIAAAPPPTPFCFMALQNWRAGAAGPDTRRIAARGRSGALAPERTKAVLF